MEIRVADYIVKYLTKLGACNVFMVAGGMMMHLIDAVGRVPEMTYYCNHHEQASAIAADAYARSSGHLGVCYATSGPGATNILTGLVGAWQESSPVIFITGQSKLSQTIHNSGIEGLRQFGVFEVDIVPIVKSVTKYAAFVDDPMLIRYHLDKAVGLALRGRPGPVLLDIPLDIQGALINPEMLSGYDEETETDPAPSSQEIQRVIQDFRSAKRPLILCGYGVRVANAVDDVHKLAHGLNCPVVVTQLAKDCFPYDDQLFVGHPGLRGDRAGNLAIQNADLILAIGCSFHNQTIGFEAKLFAPHAIKIEVELDKAVIHRSEGIVSYCIMSEAKTFIKSLIHGLHSNSVENDWDSWRKRCIEFKYRYSVIKEPHFLGLDDDPVNYYEFVDVLSDLLHGDEIVVTDAGSAFYIMGQGFKLKGSQRFICSGSLGAMGFSLPASIGAAISKPHQSTICVTGDGSFQTNIHELQTIRHYNLNIKMFIVLNDGYASIRNTQNSYFDGFLVGASNESGVTMPNISDLAKAYKIPYIDCQNRKQLNDGIHETLLTSGPVICGIWSQPKQMIMPGVGSVRLPNGEMRSNPLHEMQPLLAETELRSNMYW